MYQRGFQLAALLIIVILILQNAWKTIRKTRPRPNARYAQRCSLAWRHMGNPDHVLAQHRLLPGEYALMVGPNPGLFCVAAARLITPGWLTCLDTEPLTLKCIKETAQENGIKNIVTLVGEATHMPFPASRFDHVILINSLGKASDQEAVLAEIARVLKDNGRLTLSDSVFAPDYEPPRRVVRLAARTGFALRRRVNNIYFYTLEMFKPLKAKDQNPTLFHHRSAPESRDMAWSERQHG